MPTPDFASSIRQFLAEGENYEDFVYLFDTLVRLRRPYHRNQPASERIAGLLLCLYVPDKPKKYVNAMQQFRIGFRGVATNAEFQAEFYNCVRNAAIFARRRNDIVWRPSVYFSRSRTLHEGLREWF